MQTHKFEALDGLRGIFAILIVMGHFMVLSHIFYVPVVRIGLGVDFFFVLSGFVISYASLHKLTNARELGVFTLRRFGRVWPLHIAVLAFLIPFEGLKYMLEKFAGLTGKYAAFASGGPGSIESIFSNILLIQALNIHNTNTWNGPSWSISTEFYTYILFALLAVLFPRHLKPLTVIIGAFCAFLLFRLAPNMYAQYDYGFLRCVYGFFTGYLVYQVFKKAPSIKLAYPSITEVLCILLIIIFTMAAKFTKFSMLAPLIFALPVYVFAFQQGVVSKFLRTRPLQVLGVLSYAIYITHAIPLLIFQRGMTFLEKYLGTSFHITVPPSTYNELFSTVYVIGSPWVMDLMVVAFVLIVIAFAYVASRLIETPGRTYFNNLAKRWAQRQTAGTSHKS